MSEIIHAFGVDWRLLLVQAVNFGLLLLILWQFLYKPLIRLLEERRAKIEEGVVYAERAQERVHAIEQERQEVLKTAAQEGEGMVERARKQAAEVEHAAVLEAERKAASLITIAERQAEESRAQILQESKRELAKLIVLGAERIIREGKTR